jgi:hypothetical protein
MKLMRETWIMAAICVFDLIGTLWLMHHHLAGEANPVMKAYLAKGEIYFVGVKLFWTFVPLALLEVVARCTGMWVRPYLRTGIIAYIGMHVVNFLAFAYANVRLHS